MVHSLNACVDMFVVRRVIIMGGQPGAGTPDTAIVGLGRVGQH